MRNRVVYLIVFCLLLSLLLFAQGTTSRVIGVVQDATGAVVPGATVTLTNEGTSLAFTTTTTVSGNYVFDSVQTGTYTLAMEAAGFRKFVSRNNDLTIGLPMTVNATLQVGPVSEQVEVSGTAELVQTSTSGNFGVVLTDTFIKDLPIVGTRSRSPLDLVYVQPGVVYGGNAGGLINVHGARDRAWNYTLDGIDDNDVSMGGSNTTPTRMNPDSVSELRILTGNFTADAGRNSGAQVAMVTRSGTNEFHGAAFEFYRTPRLNANEWENNFNNVGKKQLVQHVYGGSIGGPVLKNKTFFFLNIQRLHEHETQLATRTVYTDSARNGILRYVKGGRNTPYGATNASVDASGNPLPSVNIGTYSVVTNDPQHIGLDSKIKSVLSQMPLPNDFSGGDGLNTAYFKFTGPTSEEQQDNTLKIDEIINAKNTVFGRVSWGHQNTNCDSVNLGLPMYPGGACIVNTQRVPRNFALNWRWNPTARITNELVVGMSKYLYNFDTPTADANGISIYGPAGNTYSGMVYPPIDAPTTADLGNLRRLTTWQFVDNAGYFRGSHAIKFGTNLRFVTHSDIRGNVAGYDVTENVDFATSINTVDRTVFNIPTDIQTANDLPNMQANINFLLGRVGNITRAFVTQGDQYVAKPYNFSATFGEYDFYIHDTWKARKNLTLDLGLRWEIKMSPTSSSPILHPNQLMTAGATPTQNVTWVPGQLYNDALKNFGPSIGFAWDPTGKGKTSIRANYRIAFDRINTFVLSGNIFQNLPGITTALTNTDYGQAGGRFANVPMLAPPSVKPSDFRQPPAFSSNTVYMVDPSLVPPETHQWSFSIQRQIAKSTVLEANYIGRRAYHLLGAYNANQAFIFNNGFLDAFKIVKAGGDSSMMNSLLAGDSRLNAGENGSQLVRRLYPTQLQTNSVAALANTLGTLLQSGKSIPVRSGLSPFALIPFPQFGGGVRVIDSNDFSTYHALELQLEHRFSSGLQLIAAYTLSKSLDTRSFDPASTTVSTGNSQSASSTPFDINNRRLNYALSDFDRTHAVQISGLYQLPFGKGKRFASGASSTLDRIIGSWEVSGGGRITSGMPITLYSGYNTVSNVVQATANCSGGCDPHMGKVFDQAGIKYYLTPAQTKLFSTPDPGQLGNSGRDFLRGPGYFGFNMALLKRIPLREKMNLEFRADAVNFTNSPSFGLPTATVSSSTFGQIRSSVASSSRKIQLGMKLNF